MPSGHLTGEKIFTVSLRPNLNCERMHKSIDVGISYSVPGFCLAKPFRFGSNARYTNKKQVCNSLKNLRGKIRQIVRLFAVALDACRLRKSPVFTHRQRAMRGPISFAWARCNILFSASFPCRVIVACRALRKKEFLCNISHHSCKKNLLFNQSKYHLKCNKTGVNLKMNRK